MPMVVFRYRSGTMEAVSTTGCRAYGEISSMIRSQIGSHLPLYFVTVGPPFFVGMPQETLAHPFHYMFTTASNTVCIDFPSILNAVEKKPQTSATNENLPLCGFGFGLATSKLVTFRMC